MAMFDMVAHLATPIAGTFTRAPGFYSTILNGDMDLLDLSQGVVGGGVQVMSNVMKDALGGIGGGKAVQAAVEGLTLCL